MVKCFDCESACELAKLLQMFLDKTEPLISVEGVMGSSTIAGQRQELVRDLQLLRYRAQAYLGPNLARIRGYGDGEADSDS